MSRDGHVVNVEKSADRCPKCGRRLAGRACFRDDTFDDVFCGEACAEAAEADSDALLDVFARAEVALVEHEVLSPEEARAWVWDGLEPETGTVNERVGVTAAEDGETWVDVMVERGWITNEDAMRLRAEEVG